MATLLKLDNTFLNLDNVTNIHSYELNGWNVIVYYNTPVPNLDKDGMLEQDFDHFTGKDAVALRLWLEKHSTDLLAWHGTEVHLNILQNNEAEIVPANRNGRAKKEIESLPSYNLSSCVIHN